MPWWESAAAPDKDEQPRAVRREPGVSKRLNRKSKGFLGSFGCTRHAGFVRSAQPLGFVRCTTQISDGPVATSPRARRRMGILPHFRRPDHRDLNRSDILLTCGGIGRASERLTLRSWHAVFAPTNSLALSSR
jgi:hypothetical protein